MPKISVLAGDGVGPEVIAQSLRVLQWLRDSRGFTCDVTEHDYGYHLFKRHGKILLDDVLAAALQADAVLFGAVGGPEYDDVPVAIRRSGSVLRLRTEMGVFANLRPAFGFAALADAGPYKREAIDGVDLVLVREGNGGIYFGDPRGIEDDGAGGNGERAFNTEVYTTGEIARVARIAFELARTRTGRLCSVDKSNVLETGVLWRKVVTAVHRDEFADVALSHMLVDNCCMQLAARPSQFDVLVTSNMFGDILSDGSAAIMGSLGMAPSASLASFGGDAGTRRGALYEPVHGSAPDIAGRGIANPIGAIWSLALAMRYSFDRADIADEIMAAIRHTLGAGIRTADICGPHAPVSTAQMGDAILAALAGQSAD